MADSDGVLVPGVLRENSVERTRLSDDSLRLLLDYEQRFLKPLQIAEKLYCDICYRANRADGCRASVLQNGFTGIAHIECRCRIQENKGLVN